jgi:hypothetical protein
MKIGNQIQPYHPSLRITNFQNNFTSNKHVLTKPLNNLIDPPNAKNSIIRLDILQKSSDKVKSFTKIENMSASKDPLTRQKQKLIRKQSSKRRIRPGSHRRIIRASDNQESEKTASIVVRHNEAMEDFYDDGEDPQVEIFENESLWGSSLDFDDGEGEGEDDDYEGYEDETEPAEITSNDNVSAASNAHKVFDGSELQPEMRKHFDKISCEYNLKDSNESQMRENLLNKSPTKDDLPGNSSNIVIKKSSIFTNYSQSFENNNAKYAIIQLKWPNLIFSSIYNPEQK